jgi:hypothetical protein
VVVAGGWHLLIRHLAAPYDLTVASARSTKAMARALKDPESAHDVWFKEEIQQRKWH